MTDDRKPKTIACLILTPIRPPLSVDYNTSNSVLGDILTRRFADDVRAKRPFKLTRTQHHDWIMGLRDGGVFMASKLYDMLSVSEVVEVTVSTRVSE